MQRGQHTVGRRTLGFKRAIVPRRIRSSEAWPPGLEVIEARSLKDALKAALISN
jgi:DNA repair protein RadA/Sms